MIISIFKVRNSFPMFAVSNTNVSAIFRLWLRRANTRRQLKYLTEEQLRDVGLTKIDVLNETQKSFWQD